MPPHCLDGFARLIRRIGRDTRANVLVMTAIGAMTLAFAMGFVVDYSRAQAAQAQLNAVADAAALAAVDPSLIYQAAPIPQNTATALFKAQAAQLAGVSNVQVAVTIVAGASVGQRTATVSFTAQSTNLFGNILGLGSLALSGSAIAAATLPPSINFYIALDTSPSMLLPTTSTGIANLKAGAIWTGEQYYFGRVDGCDFACHSVNMQQWNGGVYVIDSNANEIFLNASGSNPSFYRFSCNYNVYDNNGTLLGNNASISSGANYCNNNFGPASNPTTLKYLPNGKSNTPSNYVSVSVNFPDTWWLAQNYAAVNPGQAKINLRTDDESDAAANVIQYAYTLQQQLAGSAAPPTYQIQYFTFNVGSPVALGTSPFGTMTPVSTLQSLSFPNLGTQAPLMAANTYWTSTSTYTGNADSWMSSMLAGMQAVMPASAGGGTTANPLSVLIIITDGMEDSTPGAGSGLTSADLATCAAIKASGTRIAVLYTQYLASTINYTANPSFNNYANNVVPTISGQLQSCATQNADGSYLMQTVTTNGNISAALNQLFAQVVQTAYLVQ